MKLCFLLFVAATTISAIIADHTNLENFEWGELSVRLPKPLSDHTASVGPNGVIYIAGGCDSVDGNVYVAIDEDEGFFSCDSLSSSLYAFDPTAKQFEELRSLPRPRYRHSSSIVGNQIWLIGGRDIGDSLIPEIDVYDIVTKEWSTATLPDEYQVSDHAGFALEPSYVYIVGGYNGTYTAMDLVSRLDVSSLKNASLVVEPMAPIATARGDIIGVVATDGSAGYISGGFTHTNGFCSPLGSTEEYLFEEDQWNTLPPLINERGEVVLVEVDNNLYALGGERQIEGYCDGAGEGLNPGELTVGTDEVEFYDPGHQKWEVVAGFPNHKFRFAAAVGSDGTIYAFGGQTAHDVSCQCFRTTDTVAVFGEGLATSTASIFTVGNAVLAALAVAVTTIA